eukprot:TRINITY_DN954_c0_g1_i1.p2 TRINITY_DN954_c0_g1~~TRINITY_DN954_c0_g1_i1.p2  ORF type:complete len:316 (+),score=86.04 TRINITY_DN954_c0_g1_i1:1911-2858(+)
MALSGGVADEVRDTTLKVLVSKLSDSSLSNKSDEWVEGLFAKLKKSKMPMIKKSQKFPDDVALIEKAFVDDATIADKIAFFKVWVRTLIPKKNYCWIADYPTNYLMCMLRLVHPRYEESWPKSNKEMILLFINQWFNSVFKKTKRRREDTPPKVKKTKKDNAPSETLEDKPVVEAKEEKAAKSTPKAKAKAKKEEKSATPSKEEEEVGEQSLEVIAEPSLAAMNEPAPEVPCHLQSLDYLSTGTPDMSLEEKKGAMSLIAAIKDTIMRGDSEVATISDLALGMGVDASQVKAAAKMMHKHDELLYDESVGVVYVV